MLLCQAQIESERALAEGDHTAVELLQVRGAASHLNGLTCQHVIGQDV
jgi:hypothetical protein